jgi:hypothetical protein
MNIRSHIAGCLLIAVTVVGCATPSPAIRVNSAPTVNFSSYNTFGFPEQTGTDRGGYSTFITDYFKTAVRRQMESRGFLYVDENPDLLVNFFANVHERTEVRSMPGGLAASGYYGYRYGLYGAWPYYEREIESVTYPVGTANIDVVDARTRQLIWEGIAQGRIPDRAMDNPQSAINGVVTQLFARFPGRARVVESSAATG